MPAAPSRRRGSQRDRRGRGLRRPLAPPGVPLSRTRAEEFDDLVLDAVEQLERQWRQELAGVEFAVEEVPYVESGAAEQLVHGSDVVEDGNVPLARLLPAEGERVPARIVVYRRPLEVRARGRHDLADLVHDVVVEQVANLLGRDPEEIDPAG
ncbi:MAG: metallopeptidase family protein [Geodermatophilaceae bacterium]|nr:metallopeptidase family protein [Geodermatophilaceae bacterium]